jgi:hypothetical protein
VYQYSVAISFLSADESLAHGLKSLLEPRLKLPVFIYSDRQHELTGKTFEEALSPVFKTLSQVVVVLYRPGWGETGGTLVESRAISVRRRQSSKSFLFMIAVESGDRQPPWAEELIYHDLHKYSLEDAVVAILRILEHGESAENVLVEAQSQPTPERIGNPSKRGLRQFLIFDFTSQEGIYRGYFGGPSGAQDSKRWQPKGGEIVDSSIRPKLPYSHTYWGYEAALRLVPDRVCEWIPITLGAIDRHFGAGRWLRVVREFSFSDGPRTAPGFAESVRHTTRAAELTCLLSANHRRVSEVAWELIREANQLQHTDGGWPEFRDVQGPSSLWSTAYVHRFLSKLSQQEQTIPDEREEFLAQVEPLLLNNERFLATHWENNRWSPNPRVAWDEGAAAILAEIGPFLSEEALALDIYRALRATLTPAGRLAHPMTIPSELQEAAYTLRLVFGLKSVGRGLAENDTRYLRAVEWLAGSLDLAMLTTYDIAFAMFVFNWT